MFKCIFLVLSLVVFTTSCGGGGSSSPQSGSGDDGGGDDQGGGNEAVTWESAGTIENEVLLLKQNIEDDTFGIYILDTSSNESKLTPDFVDGGKVARIKISPDGEKIAYLADQETDDVYELYVMNRDGSVNIKVSPDIRFGDIRSMSWSSDSQKLYYQHSYNNDLGADQYLSDFDGSNRVLIDSSDLTEDGGSVSYIWGEEQNVAIVRNPSVFSGALFTIEVRDFVMDAQMSSWESDARTQAAGWSFDGRFFAYVTDVTSGSDEVPTLYVYDSVSGERQSLEVGETAFAFRWSPNSYDYVFWARFDEDTYRTAYKYNAVTEELVSLINQVSNSFNVLLGGAWSADENKLYYAAQLRSDITELFSIDASGAGITFISDTAGVGSSVELFKLSGDGRVALRSESAGERFSDVFVSELSGANPIDLSEVLDIQSRIRDLVWQFDGTKLYVRHGSDESDVDVISEYDFGNGSARLVSGVSDDSTNILCIVSRAPDQSSCNHIFDER